MIPSIVVIAVAVAAYCIGVEIASSRPCPSCKRPHLRAFVELWWYECRSSGCGTIWDIRSGKVVGRRRRGAEQEIVLFHRDGE